MFDTVADELGERDPASLGDDEITAVIDRYTPHRQLSPSFENLFGSVKGLMGKVAGEVRDLARKGAAALGKAALKPLLRKIKGLMKPFLKGVLERAIAKLPAELQPVARTLAERLPMLRETDDTRDAAQAGPDVTALQHELDRQITKLVFAADDVGQELEVARAATSTEVAAGPTLADLDEARERFVAGLRDLREGEDPTPVVERFLPALYPVLQTAMKLGGRKYVVDFLAPLVSRLIGRFVGPRYTPALSRALADIGLRTMGFELTDDAEAHAATAAVAATVEETVRRVADLPEHVLDTPELLEAAAVEAFEQAAASNLPPILSEETYRERPELRSTPGIASCWVTVPPGKGRYKKLSRPITRRLSPHAVAAVGTVGGASLGDVLQEQLGLAPGEEVEAQVHLYESLPGTSLPEIARLEGATPGAGTWGEQAAAQIHPLTPTAAAALLGDARQGHPTSARALGSRRNVEVGDRFYRLAIPGRTAERWLLSLPHYAALTPVELAKQLGLGPAEDEKADGEIHKGGRDEGTSIHTFGLAVDIKYQTNPWVKGDNFSRALRHAALLVSGEPLGDQKSQRYFNSLGTNKSLSTTAIYRIVAQRDRDFREYLKLRNDLDGVVRRLSTLRAANVPGVFEPISETDDHAAARWQRTINEDHDNLAKTPTGDPPEPFLERPLENGFLNLAEDLVVALRDKACLVWGAVDLGPGDRGSGDMMHFDARACGIGAVLAATARQHLVKAGHPCLDCSSTEPPPPTRSPPAR